MAKSKKSEAPAGRVVAASATMMGRDRATDRGQRIEAAMIKATEDAMAEGVSDPKEILKRKLAARAAAIDEGEG